MAVCRGAILALLVLAASLQLSACLLKEIKSLRGGLSQVRREEPIPAKEISKHLPLVSLCGHSTRVNCVVYHATTDKRLLEDREERKQTANVLCVCNFLLSSQLYTREFTRTWACT